ncbi:hypothetical protein JCM30760_10400 [Thiomicrorhabdus hydrogeniphila]
MGNDKSLFVWVTWGLYVLGILTAFLTEGDALFLAAPTPIWFILGMFILGLISLILGIEKTPRRGSYITTGLVVMVSTTLIFLFWAYVVGMSRNW